MDKNDHLPDEFLLNKIYLIRNEKVMLDKDIAALYGVKAIRLREQVKRNRDRFPDSFMFQLTLEETDFMVSQNAIPSKKHLGGHLPYVFTEHGILMLANVLKSNLAIKMSIRIIELFVRFRKLLLANKDVLLKMEKIEKTIAGYENNFRVIFEYLKQFERAKDEQLEYKNRKKIGYKDFNTKDN